MGTIIALCNQKGGVGKSTTCTNLGIGLARQGKRVLLTDVDPQGSLTICMGNQHPEDIPNTLSVVFESFRQGKTVNPQDLILHHPEGVDYLPANITLSGEEVALVNTMCRESILRSFLSSLRDSYDYILVDSGPSLGMLTVNTLTAADRIIIPVQAQFLSVKGLELLLGTIGTVRRNLNPKLKIEGVLITIAEEKTNFGKNIIRLVRENYGSALPIFKNVIPKSIRIAEASAAGQSIYSYDPKGKAAQIYEAFSKEVAASAEKSVKRDRAEKCR